MTGCQDSGEFFVDVKAMPKPQIDPNSISGCVPLTATFSESSENPNYICNWYFETGSVMNKSSVTRTFTRVGGNPVKMVVTDDYGCMDSVEMVVQIYPKPTADFDILNQGTIYTEDTVKFRNTSTGAVRYQWDLYGGDQSTSLDTMKQYPEPGSYPIWLWAYNANGCADSIVKYVDIKVRPWILVPSAFTPNGDGLNDVFEVQYKYITSFDMLLYNRWGEIVYRTQDVNFKWDATYLGKEVISGPYVYVIFARSYYGHAISLKGDVNVIR